MTLELSAHSPSDFEHWCGELADRAGDTAWCLHDAKVSGDPGLDIHGGKLVLKLFLMGSTEMSPIDLVEGPPGKAVTFHWMSTTSQPARATREAVGAAELCSDGAD